MLTCFYALGGINYKNGVITTCPRQANQLVFANETILPSQIFNHKRHLGAYTFCLAPCWRKAPGAQSVAFHVVFGNFRSTLIKKHVFIAPSESASSKSTINTCFLFTFERNVAKST